MVESFWADQELSTEDSALFTSLLYFEIFNFPLTLRELWSYSACGTIDDLRTRLNRWVGQGYILKEDKYYMLSWCQSKVFERLAGERRARQMWARAKSRALLIQSCPFVEAVFVSGSISKGVAAPDADVDFFMITKPGRLWLGRTLLALFKKTLLLGSHKYFCINYFIDSEHLEIEDQNRFTATEMATLIPMTGDRHLVQEFYRANPWVQRFYPNFVAPAPCIPFRKDGWWKSFFEKILDAFGAPVFDQISLWATSGFWRLKFRKMSRSDFKHALKSDKHISKHHPLQFQKHVLKAFDMHVREFEDTQGMKLSL